MSLKWYRACTVLGLSGAQKSAGWPQDFDLDSIAKLQYPQCPQDGTELIGAMQSDCANGSLKCRTKKNLVHPSIVGLSYEAAFKQALRAPVEVTADHVGASDIWVWLQKQGVEPSAHLLAWFEDQGKIRTLVSAGEPGAAAPGPAQNTVTPASVLAVVKLDGVETEKDGLEKSLISGEPAVVGSRGWTLFRPQRFQGYGKPLYDLLKAANITGQPLPTARDVLNAWRLTPPIDVFEIMADGLKYYDSKGNTKTADLEAIRKSIGRRVS